MDSDVKHAKVLIAALGVALICSPAFAEGKKPVPAAKRLAGVEKRGPVATHDLKGSVPTGGGHSNLTGGPDGFGYYFMDQLEPLLNYNWLDISTTGTNIVNGHNRAATAALTDPFTFYGQVANSLRMSTNGYLSTSLTDSGADSTNDCPLPATPDVGGGARMYPFHDDLVTGAGYVEYYADCPRDNELAIDGNTTESCTVFQWDDTTHFGSTATFSFETILYHESNVVLHQITFDPDEGAFSTTGIQRDQSVAAHGLTYKCDSPASLVAGTAVAFYVCTPIALNPTTLPDGDCSVPYNQAILASGGTAPYTFAATGTLPTGLTLDAAGNLTGTPPAGTTGSFTFTVTATDAKGCTGSQQYTVAINCGTAISLSPDCLPEGTEGGFYSFTLGANGGTGPYTFTMTGTVPGLSLSPTGTLSGNPTTAGSYSITVTATDTVGGSGQRTYPLFIGDKIDIIVGSGLGFPNPNEVMVYDATGAPTTVDFLAYGSNQWGTNVASGNIADGPSGDTTSAEILTGPGPGDVYGPHVRGWFRDGVQIAKVNLFAYGTLKYGVNVAGGNVDGDTWDEIVSGAGPGVVFGPHVRGWNYDNNTLDAIAKISYFAYNTLRYGVNVSTGDLDQDSSCADEILTGAGPGAIFGATVRGWNYDGVQLTQIAKINFNAFSVNYGVNVAGGDVDGDFYAEIITATGPGSTLASQFSGFNFDAGSVAALGGYSNFTPPTWVSNYGGRVGLGDIDQDGGDDLLAGKGRDPVADSTLCTYTYNGAGLAATSTGCFQAFAGQTYGVNEAGGKLGW